MNITPTLSRDMKNKSPHKKKKNTCVYTCDQDQFKFSFIFYLFLLTSELNFFVLGTPQVTASFKIASRWLIFAVAITLVPDRSEEALLTF